MVANRGFADLFRSGSKPGTLPLYGVPGSRTMQELINLAHALDAGLRFSFNRRQSARASDARRSA